MIHGIVFQALEYNFKHVTDGTAKTFMMGEKYIMPEAYSLSPGERPNKILAMIKAVGQATTWTWVARRRYLAAAQDQSGLEL